MNPLGISFMHQKIQCGLRQVSPLHARTRESTALSSNAKRLSSPTQKRPNGPALKGN
jgi:hypothetical protein